MQEPEGIPALITIYLNQGELGMTERIRKRMDEADLVLIGLGEELDITKLVQEDPWYQAKVQNIINSWIIPYVEKLRIGQIAKDRCSVYMQLCSMLEHKNYFIVSICQDGAIKDAGFDESRIVEPCGGYEKLQCSEKCSGKLHEVSSKLQNQIRDFLDGKLTEADLEEPCCPDCGKPLVFNNINAAHYAEEGYLSQWMRYKKWLQGTVNKNVCLLEIGVGMKYPTVIRWPFEKITFYNQKAELFRVHSKLYQMAGEIKERGFGICREPEEFLKELSNGI